MADGFPGERLVILPEAIVRRAGKLPVCRDIRVTHIGRFDRVLGHYVDRPAGCAGYVLIFVLDGRGSVRVGGSRLRLRRGHGIILPPGRAHQYEADAREPWSVFWVHFTGERAADYARAMAGVRDHGRFWVADTAPVAEAFEECYGHTQGACADADMTGLATAFMRLAGLCLTLRRPTSARRRRAEERVARGVRFLRANIGRRVSLGEVARAAGACVSHFCALFRRQVNCAPLEFFARLKMQRAADLLAGTGARVAEVADALGFDDPLYFSRCFRRQMGASPAEWRRNTLRPHAGARRRG